MKDARMGTLRPVAWRYRHTYGTQSGEQWVTNRHLTLCGKVTLCGTGIPQQEGRTFEGMDRPLCGACSKNAKGFHSDTEQTDAQ